jgi:hypothetical protein
VDAFADLAGGGDVDVGESDVDEDIDTSQQRWRCVRGRACHAVASVSYAVGRDQLDVEGLGETRIVAMVEAGMLDDFADLFSLNRADVLGLDRMGEVSTDNLLAALAQAKTKPLSRVFAALGVRGTGRSMSRRIARAFAQEVGYDDDGNPAMAILWDLHVEGDPGRHIWWIVRIRTDLVDGDPGGSVTEFSGPNAQRRMWVEWDTVTDALADSRVRHAAGARHPLTGYAQAIGALTVRGLNAFMHGDSAGNYLVVELGGAASSPSADGVTTCRATSATSKGGGRSTSTCRVSRPTGPSTTSASPTPRPWPTASPHSSPTATPPSPTRPPRSSATSPGTRTRTSPPPSTATPPDAGWSSPPAPARPQQQAGTGFT